MIATRALMNLTAQAAYLKLCLGLGRPLLGNRNNRRINHLAAASDVAPRFQMLAKTLEQFLNQTGLRKRLPEQPKRRAGGNAVLHAEPHKPRERQAVAHLILNLFVG